MQNYIKTVVEQKDVSVLKDPKMVCELLKSLVEPDSPYPYQMELLLQVTQIGELVQNPEQVKYRGRAAYDAMVMRAVRKTGFKVELAQALMQNVMEAAGIKMEDVYRTNLQDSQKLPLLDLKTGEETAQTARGFSAYQCAKLLILGDKNASSDQVKFENKNTENEKKGIAYLKVAAKDGYNPAYGMLALCYYKGIGVEQDLEEAYRCIMMPEALLQDFVGQKQDMVNKLLQMRQDNRKRKLFAVLLAAAVTVFLLAARKILGMTGIVGVILTLASLANLGYMGIYQLMIRKRNLIYAGYSTAASLIIWSCMMLYCCL